ncbi:MAG: aminotransferase class V-fold PLP-dependent enzyme [Ruminococcaceae bacterium]|nr:aminotransferase class V-fold PLP-dependent enzyme [Oscillospiraceae bacterium]
MEYGGLIYLDNAATTYPKPPEVYGETVKAMLNYGGNPGRGAHSLSLAAAKKIYECRESAAALFGISDPERVIFTLNTTYGLNTVIKGMLKSGDHVLISDMEHNAVYRPIYKMADQGQITYDIFHSYPHETKDRTKRICSDIVQKLRRNTRLVICNHTSNICSLKMPIKEIAELCKRSGVRLLVDGAQSAGHEKIRVDEMGIDALCVPGHKGLYGIQGSGMVILGRGIKLSTLVEGGNGVNSLEGKMPDFTPERYEAGTLPTPAVSGLCEGIKFVKAVGEERIAEREKELFRQTRERLGNIEGVKIYLPQHEGSVLLFNVEGFSAEEIGERLNREGICVRSGHHCSALGHRTLGTADSGGVRVSFGVFNNNEDIEELAAAVNKTVKER